MDESTLRLEVNGEPREISGVSPERRLVEILREDLGLTGTKESCAVGVCGVCSVSVNGRVVSSCLVLAGTINGATVRTVEGLSGPDGTLTRLQRAFIEHGGFQCGICTPGQLMMAAALLAENPAPDEHDVREWLAGNLCRCTGYQQIVESVLAGSLVEAS